MVSRQVSISLLHATHQSLHSSETFEARWRSTAKHPGRIEHIFAMDHSAKLSVKLTRGSRRVVTRRPDAKSTAVANWNAAANSASGDLLFVIADDLIPYEGWDEGISIGLTPSDCRNIPFAIKVSDSHLEKDSLLRHPIISREFYAQNGLFDPDFRGVYCDDDLTLRAFCSSQILDRRNVIFQHCSGANISESKMLLNREDEYLLGLNLIRQKWGLYLKIFSTRKLFLRKKLMRLRVCIFFSRLALLFLSLVQKITAGVVGRLLGKELA